MSNYDTPYNYPFCRLQKVVEGFTQSTSWTNKSKLKKIPVKPTNKKTLFKTFGASVINIQCPHPGFMGDLF